MIFSSPPRLKSLPGGPEAHGRVARPPAPGSGLGVRAPPTREPLGCCSAPGLAEPGGAGSERWTASWDLSSRSEDPEEERGKSTDQKRITTRAMRMCIITLRSIFEVSAPPPPSSCPSGMPGLTMNLVWSFNLKCKRFSRWCSLGAVP